MKKFDIVNMKASAYDRRGKNVFYEVREFKVRIIDLPPGQSMPRCDMTSHVVFVCIEGKAEVSFNNEKTPISRGQCVVTKPATISMNSDTGARLLGIQIAPRSME